jgi:predicted nucleic acid-binding protein
VAERPVINASPLIFLSKAGLLSLLKIVGEELVVPKAVALEIQRRGQNDPTVQALATTAWLVIIEIPAIPV